MDIVCFGQQNWNICWTAKQQLMTRLAERGHRVLYVDPMPAEPKDAERLARSPEYGVPGLRRIGPRDLWVYSYLRVPGLRWRLNRMRFHRMAPRVLAEIGFQAPVGLCLHPMQLPVMERSGCRAWVYYAVDEYTAYGETPEWERRIIRDQENSILERAELVLAVSPRLHERFARTNPESHLLENGSDAEHYHPDRLDRIAVHPAMADLSGPVVGLFGQIDDRIDQDLVIELARRHGDWTFAMAGRVRGIDPARLQAEPNIRLLGFQPYEVLPNFAKAVDVWWLPYVQSELTNACNPLKLFEYLATGKPVVATPLDGIRSTRHYVDLASGVDGFDAALTAAIADPAKGRGERLAATAANDWYDRVDRLEAFLERAVGIAAARGRPEARALVPARRMAARSRRLPYISEHGLPREPYVGRVQRVARLGTGALGKTWYAARLAARAVSGDPAPVRNILVVRHGFLGDFVVMMPALAHLRRRYPEARIVLGVQHDMTSAPLFDGNPYVDEVIGIDFLKHKGSRAAQLRGMAGLFARGFDLVIAGGEPNALPEGHQTGAPRYYGLYDGYPDQELQGRLMTRDGFRHEADNNLALVEAITGVPATEEQRAPVLPLPEPVIAERAAAIGSALDLPVGGRVLTIHPGSKRASRRWPLERLAEVATRLLTRMDDLTVVLTGGGGEKELTGTILAGIPDGLRGRVRDAAGATDLLGLVALLDRSAALLSNDTGVMHLGRSRGTPLVALLGPENDKLWGPHPLGPGPAIALRRIVPCAPCQLDRCGPHYCMRGLTVDEVEAAVLSMIGTGRPADGRLVPLDARRRRAGWKALAAEGYALPLVTVLARADSGRSLAATLDAVLPVVERQSYPNIEILGVGGPADAGWSDGRDPVRRQALPIRTVIVEPGMDPASRAAPAAAWGELVAPLEPGQDWPSAHLAVAVAAATRAPEFEVFRDGRPVPGAGADTAALPGAVLRRRSLLSGSVAASAELRQGGALAPPVTGDT